MFLDLTCDEACFRFGIESLKVANAFTWRVLRPQGFFFALNVVPDDAAGDVEDVLRRAIILFEADYFRVGKVLFEFQDISDVSSAPTID